MIAFLEKTHFIFKMIIIVLFLTPVLAATDEYVANNEPYYQAYFNITYTDPQKNKTESHKYDSGRFGIGSTRSAKLKVANEQGRVVVVRTVDEGKTNGCANFNITVPSVKWVALIARGECPFVDKIHMAKEHNASAVVIYNHLYEHGKHVMTHGAEGIVAISIPKKEGWEIAKVVDRGINVTMYITVGGRIPNNGVERNPSNGYIFIIILTVSFSFI